MRILLALIYILVGMFGYVYLGGDKLHPLIALVPFFALIFSAPVVCNEGFLRRLKGQSEQEYIHHLLTQKKATKVHYKACRAITFESASCLCYMLEIDAEKILCLYGQYLYDYCLIDDDIEFNQARAFPTSEFSLIRRLKNNEVLALNVGEEVIDELVVDVVDTQKLYDFGFRLQDGEILEGVSFDDLVNKIV